MYFDMQQKVLMLCERACIAQKTENQKQNTTITGLQIALMTQTKSYLMKCDEIFQVESQTNWNPNKPIIERRRHQKLLLTQTWQIKIPSFGKTYRRWQVHADLQWLRSGRVASSDAGECAIVYNSLMLWALMAQSNIRKLQLSGKRRDHLRSAVPLSFFLFHIFLFDLGVNILFHLVSSWHHVW